MESLPEKGLTNTGKIILTFETTNLPERIRVGMEVIKVEKFYPNPIQCARCLTFDHHVSQCREQQTFCGKCGDGHAEDKCAATKMNCRNCKGDHHAKSRMCPKFAVEAQIIKVAVQNNVPRHVAKKSLQTEKTTFADVVSQQHQRAKEESNVEALLQKVLQQQKMLLNIILTGTAHGMAEKQNSENNKEQTTQQIRQPAQEHLIKFQEQLKKKRNHSPEAEFDSSKHIRTDETGPDGIIYEDNMDVSEEVIIDESVATSKKNKRKAKNIPKKDMSDF